MVQKKHYVSCLYEYLFTYRQKSLIKFLLIIHLYDFCFKNSNFNLFLYLSGGGCMDIDKPSASNF